MDFFENRYYKVARRLLILIGQWPYSEFKVKAVKRLVICFFLITYMIAQVAKLILVSTTFYKFLEYMPFVTYSIIVKLKYFNYWTNYKLVRNLLECIKKDWKSLKSKQELDVLHKYTEEGRLFTKFYSILAYSGAVGYILLLSLTPLLDAIAPLDNSTKRPLPIEFEYFVDPQKYFYPILLHMEITIIIGMSIIVATDMICILVIFHCCGMFAVIGYRLEHAFSNIEKIVLKDQDSVFSASLARTVRYQCGLREYIRIMEACYANSYAAQLFIAVIDITGVLLTIQNTLTASEGMELVFLHVVDALVHYFLIFLCIFPLQKMTDCSSDVYRSVYQSRWYEAPVKVQKLLLLIMKSNLKPAVAILAGFLIMSFETFVSIVQMTTSYFMVLHSVQQK